MNHMLDTYHEGQRTLINKITASRGIATECLRRIEDGSLRNELLDRLDDCLAALQRDCHDVMNNTTEVLDLIMDSMKPEQIEKVRVPEIEYGFDWDFGANICLLPPEDSNFPHQHHTLNFWNDEEEGVIRTEINAVPQGLAAMLGGSYGDIG